MSNRWETVVGLEIHIRLKTKTKIFSPARNVFGDAPNVNVHPCCSGFPGSLPMVSREAVIQAIKLGLCIGSDINNISSFDRKAYFYPDSPRNFQITQFFNPILTGGQLSLENGNVIRIRKAHLEDDTAQMKHLPGVTGIDFNRAGAPLIEVVTETDIKSPEEAVEFVLSLKNLAKYAHVSDCDMEKGSLRIDANVSVKLLGEGLRNKSEIKNLNSLQAISRGIALEVDRQIKSYEENIPVKSYTYRWDAVNKKTVFMREKDSNVDYMYFPEPDLLPLKVTENMIDEAKKMMPEMPKERASRYLESYKMCKHDIRFLVAEKERSDFFEKTVCLGVCPKEAFNWMSEFSGKMSGNIWESNISPEHIVDLIKMIKTRKISKKIAKDLIALVVENFLLPSEIVKNNPEFLLCVDMSEVETAVSLVLNENKSAILDYKNGKGRAMSFLIGKAISSCKQTDPSIVKKVLKKQIDVLLTEMS